MNLSTLPIHCVDLFCGLGGLTHGMSRGGIRVVAGFDIDPECKFPYEENNDADFVEADVQTLTGADIAHRWTGAKYTLLSGCAPCQTFSTYSRKYRVDSNVDDRWDLLRHFGRLIDESAPDFVSMENVPQLADHHVFGEFLSHLDGYHVWWDIVDCIRYGVPQTRKRLVLLASKHGEIKLVVNPLIDEKPSVRKAIGHLTPITAGASDPNDVLHSACRLSDLNLRRIKASVPGGTWRDWDSELLAECHTKKTGDTYPGVYGRMEWDKPAPTITTQSFGYGNGRFGHPEQDRAISLREAAILQTFPESYQFLPDGVRPRFNVMGRLIGNAVPVLLGDTISWSFKCHLKQLGEVT